MVENARYPNLCRAGIVLKRSKMLTDTNKSEHVVAELSIHSLQTTTTISKSMYKQVPGLLSDAQIWRFFLHPCRYKSVDC